MAELSTLARPYAKAAFEYAVAAGESGLDSWSQSLVLLAALVKEEKVTNLLAAPGYTPAQQAKALIDLAGDSLSTAQQNYLRILSENRRLPLLAEVTTQFEVLKANREKAVDVAVISASEITPEQQEKLTQALSAKLERKVAMQVTVDRSLLGGAVVRAGDTVIDGSIRGRLAKLAEALNT